MDPRERILALLSGEEPDLVPVLGSYTVRPGPPGGWVRRLTKRGLGLVQRVCPYRPYWNFPSAFNLFLPAVRCVSEQYTDAGRHKIRFVLETPAGTVTSVMVFKATGTLRSLSREEYFIKSVADWRVFAYLFNELTRALAPNYDEITRQEDTLGGMGVTLGYLTKTAFPRAWIQLASVEQAVVDFSEQPSELCEFLDAERGFHRKAAEIAAGSPARILNIYDNITDIVSPRFFDTYCLPIYRLYADAIRGSGKVLACHMDGKVAHLKQSIAKSPIKLIDSLTVPPVGNVSLREAKTIWPDKTLVINTPPHLAHKTEEEVRLEYSRLLSESRDRRLAIEYVEDLPIDEVEPHLRAALDACGYA